MEVTVDVKYAQATEKTRGSELELELIQTQMAQKKAKILKMEHSEELEFRGKLTVIYRPHLQFYLHWSMQQCNN